MPSTDTFDVTDLHLVLAEFHAEARRAMEGGTDAEMRAYLFGERMIDLQAGMLVRLKRVSDNLDARRTAATDWQHTAIVFDRQIADYRRRGEVFRAHRGMLLALAERSRMAVLQ